MFKIAFAKFLGSLVLLIFSVFLLSSHFFLRQVGYTIPQLIKASFSAVFTTHLLIYVLLSLFLYYLSLSLASWMDSATKQTFWQAWSSYSCTEADSGSNGLWEYTYIRPIIAMLQIKQWRRYKLISTHRRRKITQKLKSNIRYFIPNVL